MAMNASNILCRMLPTIFRIITCNFVKITFEDILIHNCRPLRRSLTSLWAGFVVASLAMLPLQILWTLLSKHVGGDRQGFLAGRTSPDNFVRRIDIPSYIRGPGGCYRGIFGSCSRGILCGGGCCHRGMFCGSCFRRRTTFRMRRPGPTTFYPAIPPLSQSASRAATPAPARAPAAAASSSPTLVGTDETPLTDFSIYGDLGVSFSLLKKAIRRVSQSRSGSRSTSTRAHTPSRPGAPGSRVHTPGTYPGSRAGTPAGPRIGAPNSSDGSTKAAPPPPAGFPAIPSSRNQGFS